MAKKTTKDNKKEKTQKPTENKQTEGKDKSNKLIKKRDKSSEALESRNASKIKKITNISEIRRKNQESKEAQQNSQTGKQSSDKTLIIDDDDVEGMTVPPREEVAQSRPPSRPTESPSGHKPVPVRPARPASPAKPAKRPKPKSPVRKKQESSEDEEDGDEEDPPVKQFSFPAYKILSGASVAPVQMFPQKVVISPSEETGKRHWIFGLSGLFQNSKLTLKIRILRLVLLWIFFRVLNKQTAWLSDLLGIGMPDEEPPSPKVKPPPGERYVKVFREGDPNPIHVRVKRPL